MVGVEFLTDTEAFGSEDVDLSDLVEQTYFNGMSMFHVVSIDLANPRTHVIAQHVSMGYKFPISASIVRRYITSPSPKVKGNVSGDA
jgi:hypothetical protein